MSAHYSRRSRINGLPSVLQGSSEVRALKMALRQALSEFGGKNVLIVEEEKALAERAARVVRNAGGTVIGPVADVAAALGVIDGQKVDAAMLYVCASDDSCFSAAAILRARKMPLFFMSGNDDWLMPNELDDVPAYQKPSDPTNVVRLLFR